jgi:lysylphosphatidylglycerol synthetase-like protein (DUF2156 family)
MTNDSGNPAPASPRLDRLPLPGQAAISIYLLILAGVNVFAVVNGQVRPLYLVFSAAFIAASFGLVLSLRWAWALTLAAVASLAGLFLWRFSVQHRFFFAVQGLLNLVFFLYLVRTEVRERLR